MTRSKPATLVSAKSLRVDGVLGKSGDVDWFGVRAGTKTKSSHSSLLEDRSFGADLELVLFDAMVARSAVDDTDLDEASFSRSTRAKQGRIGSKRETSHAMADGVRLPY